LTKGRIAAAHGRFDGIRQVASMCTHLIHGSLGPSESAPQKALGSVQSFLQDRRTRTV